jgi:hypothetical protein
MMMYNSNNLIGVMCIKIEGHAKIRVNKRKV